MQVLHGLDVMPLATVALIESALFRARHLAWRKPVITTGKFGYDCSVDHSDHPKKKKS